MEIKKTTEIVREYNRRNTDIATIIHKKWVAVDDLIEWITKHDSKIEDATVYNHNSETYSDQSFHVISIKELKEAIAEANSKKGE